MTTHIVDEVQVVDYYLQGVKSKKVRLTNLINTFESWDEAGEHVKSCLDKRYVFGNARGDGHTATPERIGRELRRRFDNLD